MTISDAIDALEAEWDQDAGFLGRLRTGRFDAAGALRLQRILRELPLGGGSLDARLVALTWFIPLFISWQRERCTAAGCDPRDFDRAEAEITTLLEEKLGMP